MAVTLTNAAGKFNIAADTCDGQIIAPTATCYVDVTYLWKMPAGTHQGTLSVDDGNLTDSITLEGTR